jgi:hypothetical protein
MAQQVLQPALLIPHHIKDLGEEPGGLLCFLACVLYCLEGVIPHHAAHELPRCQAPQAAEADEYCGHASLGTGEVAGQQRFIAPINNPTVN